MSEQILSYITKVNYATSKTKSLKTGVPKEIAQILKVSAGESIEWGVNLDDGKLVIIVKKAGGID